MTTREEIKQSREARMARGQDGIPFGHTFVVVGADQAHAEQNAWTVAYATGVRALTVLHAEQIEAGWWEVTLSYEEDSPAHTGPRADHDAEAAIMAAVVMHRELNRNGGEVRVSKADVMDFANEPRTTRIDFDVADNEPDPDIILRLTRVPKAGLN